MYHAYNRTRTYVIDKLWKKWFILQILVMLLRKGKMREIHMSKY
jgi:hypothetical protein